MINLWIIDPFTAICTHEPYILYTPYHTYRIRVRIRFFPKTQIRIRIRKMYPDSGSALLRIRAYLWRA